MRPMDDFLINPTIEAMNDRHHSPTSIVVDGYVATSTPPIDMFSLKQAQKTPEASATIRSFVDEPLFWRGYASEEEVASPVEADDLSFHSATSPSPSMSQLSYSPFPEHLAQNYDHVEQQCSKAQAITFVSAGKARIVSLPKVVDSPTASRIKRAATETPIRLPMSRSHSREAESPTTSLRDSPRAISESSSDKSPVCTSTVSIVEQQGKGYKTLRRRPSLPILATTVRLPDTASSHLSTLQSQSTDFLNHDPFPSSEKSSPPMTPTKRKLHKFSSSLGLSVFAKVAKGATSSDDGLSENFETVPEPEPTLTTSTQIPARESRTRTKMIPRGANERAPPIVLPPCPESYDEEDDFVFRSTAPTCRTSRKDLKTSPPLPKTNRLHRRQRSYSTAWITSQA